MPDSLRPQSPTVVPQKNIYTPTAKNNHKAAHPKHLEAALNDLSKTHSNSYYPQIFKVKGNRISRKYYNNNIFDIDESDNPFALPISGQKNKPKHTSLTQKKYDNSFSQLFAIQKQTTNETSHWLIFVLLGILSFMSILIAIYPKEIGGLFKTFMSTSSNFNTQRERVSLFRTESIANYLLFVLGMGTFCFLIPQVLYSDLQFNTFGALILSISGVTVIYFLKHFQLKVLSFILPFPQEIDSYNTSIANTNKVLGFILVPILFLIANSPINTQIPVLYTSIGLLGLVYLYRTIKGLVTAGSIILFHKFHFFVYLCAVEIAPILILLKLLSIL